MVPRKIVIVEDDAVVRQLLTYHVQNLGHEVLASFGSGQEVVEYFKSHNADLILMDIRLEDSIDGIEAMRQIQEVSSVPVVYISGESGEGHLKRAINTNMKGFLSKPVSSIELEDAIDSLTELTESILYAERIQKAIFPERKDFDGVFGDYVYLNRPRNIISGDFAFLEVSEDEQQILGGVGDCTGHGIPAALLSVLSHEIVTSLCKRNTELNKILYLLNRRMIVNLSRGANENQVNDGLDISIFRLIPSQGMLEVSGFRRPFLHFESETGEVKVYSFRGHGIGSEIESESEIPVMQFHYAPNDFFFFFSDGVTDQFGGPKSKKLSKRGLGEILSEICKKSGTPSSRNIALDLALRKWQGQVEQTDDMILFGIKPATCKKQN